MVLGLLGFVLALVVLAVAAGVAFAVVLATRSKQEYDASNVTVPGRSGQVPASWAGSHEPEALLHRRLVAAMAALRANQSFDDDGALLDIRVGLEQQALGIDEHLVAVSALPRDHKAEPLAKAEESVAAIEGAVVDLATRAATDSAVRVQTTVTDLEDRTEFLGQVQSELDKADPTVAQTAPPPPAAAPAPAPATNPPAPPAPPVPPVTEPATPPATDPPTTPSA